MIHPLILWYRNNIPLQWSGHIGVIILNHYSGHQCNRILPYGEISHEQITLYTCMYLPKEIFLLGVTYDVLLLGVSRDVLLLGVTHDTLLRNALSLLFGRHFRVVWGSLAGLTTKIKTTSNKISAATKWRIWLLKQSDRYQKTTLEYLTTSANSNQVIHPLILWYRYNIPLQYSICYNLIWT